MTAPYGIDPQREPPTIAGLLDGLIDQGVHVAGDLVIGLAEIDLIRISLRLLVASEDTAQRTGVRAGENPASPKIPPARLQGRPAAARDRSGPPHGSGSPGHQPRQLGRGTPRTRPPPSPVASRPGPSRPADAEDREQLVRGVSQLVLTIVELVRELIERQAVRRVEAGNLSSDQVERLGVALQTLEERMDEVKDVFGLSDEELNLDLGPLGRLR